jgi:uncharacterized ferritin-like protein (DUF455 family)
MPDTPEAGVCVRYGAGMQRGSRLVRHTAGGEGVKVAGEERDHFMLLDDRLQMMPMDGLLSKHADANAVRWFLRPAKAGQHKIKFR